jgi:hypothetical protein
MVTFKLLPFIAALVGFAALVYAGHDDGNTAAHLILSLGQAMPA